MWCYSRPLKDSSYRSVLCSIKSIYLSNIFQQSTSNGKSYHVLFALQVEKRWWFELESHFFKKVVHCNILWSYCLIKSQDLETLIGTLNLLFFQPYFCSFITVKGTPEPNKRYATLIVLIWLFAAFWALMPALGWARYGFEPSVTSCSIDWRHNDMSYKTYLLCYFFCGFVMPLVAMVYFYSRMYGEIKRRDVQPVRSDPIMSHWTHQKNIGKVL